MNLIHKPLSLVLCNHFLCDKSVKPLRQVGIDPYWRGILCSDMYILFANIRCVDLWFSFPSHRAWQWKGCKWLPCGERALFLAHTAVNSIWNITFFCALIVGSFTKRDVVWRLLPSILGYRFMSASPKICEASFAWHNYICFIHHSETC